MAHPFADELSRRMRKFFKRQKSGDEPNAINSSENGDIVFPLLEGSREELPSHAPRVAEVMRHPSAGFENFTPILHAPFLTERADALLMGEIVTGHDLLDMISSMVDAKGTKRAVAAQFGISEHFLGDVLLGRRPMSAKLAEALGYEKITVYRRK